MLLTCACFTGGYLLGDSAYPLLPWFLTPYKTTTRGLNSQLEKCNCAHSQQRVIIGGTFGLLKNRFRRLFYVNEASIKHTFVIIIWSICSSQFVHSLQWWWGQWWLCAYIISNDDDRQWYWALFRQLQRLYCKNAVDNLSPASRHVT